MAERELTEEETIAWFVARIRERDELMLPSAVRRRAVEQATKMRADGGAIWWEHVDGWDRYRVGNHG